MTRKAISDSWNEFFHRPVSPAALSVFRVLFALSLWFEVATTRTKSVFAIAGGFHLPYSPLVGPLSQDAYQLLSAGQYPLILLIALGVVMRPAAAVLLLLQARVFFADQLAYRNHPYFFMLVLLLLIFSPADRALSVRAMYRARGRGERYRDALLGAAEPPTVQRLLQLQIAIVYVFSALHKLHPRWLDGRRMSEILFGGGDITPPDSLLRHLLGADGTEALSAFLTDSGTLPALSVATLALELILAGALFHRPVRPLAMVLGVLLHAGFAVSLQDVWTFSLAMLASYLLFIDPDRARFGLARILRSAQE